VDSSPRKGSLDVKEERCPKAGGNKAELSSLSAQTKLMPFWYKAELSSLSAQTKLMPLGIKGRSGGDLDPIDNQWGYAVGPLKLDLIGAWTLDQAGDVDRGRF